MEQFSLPLLPETPSPLSRTLEGLYELTKRSSRTFNSPHVLLPELKRNKEIVSCFWATCRGPWTDTIKNNWQKPSMQVCWKRTFKYRSLIVISQQNKIELVTRPDLRQRGQSGGWHNHNSLNRTTTAPPDGGGCSLKRNLSARIKSPGKWMTSNHNDTPNTQNLRNDHKKITSMDHINITRQVIR